MEIKAGIDIGSVTTKCVILKDNKILSKALILTGMKVEECAESVFNRAVQDANISKDSISGIISTGYGRRRFEKADKIVTEISAAGLGAFTLSGNRSCAVIDVGGQDTKIIEVGAHGEVIDFIMNDKCAAGTGRFLEMMAKMLETDLDKFSDLALKCQNPVTINSTCSVFAESEVVSLLASACKKEDIAAGLVKSIGVRIAGMFSQFRHMDYVVFCGGGAQSIALKKELENTISKNITVIDAPQFVTAFGAALA